MTIVPVNITVEMMEHADGRPVAYIDATAVAVFAYQEPDGMHVIPAGSVRLSRRSGGADCPSAAGSA